MTALPNHPADSPGDRSRSPATTDDARPAAAQQAAGGAQIGLAQLPTLISVSRAATVLGISRAAAYRYAACGDLPTVRLGGRVYIVTARLRAFLESA